MHYFIKMEGEGGFLPQCLLLNLCNKNFRRITRLTNGVSDSPRSTSIPIVLVTKLIRFFTFFIFDTIKINNVNITEVKSAYTPIVKVPSVRKLKLQLKILKNLISPDYTFDFFYTSQVD